METSFLLTLVLTVEVCLLSDVNIELLIYSLRGLTSMQKMPGLHLSHSKQLVLSHSHSGYRESVLVNCLQRVWQVRTILLTLACLLYTSPSPRDATLSRMPSSA